MPQKPGPYILFFSLIAILVFIIGIRYGQNVEKTNKKVNFYLSLPPTKPPAPTETPLEFNTYKHPGCGLSFLYPNSLKIEKESSYSAKLKNGKIFISFDCQKNATAEPTIDPKYQTLEKLNLKNGKKIIFLIEKSLLPLLEKSLEFIK